MGENGAIKDRIKSLRRVNVSELQVHPKNFRKHAQGQRRAMSAALHEIGFADALLVCETPDGLQIIDGHLRADLAKDQKVPVLVLDVNEQEADKLLATFDAITGLAEIDEDLLRSLTDGLEFEAPELDELIAGLLGDEPADITEDDPPEAKDRPTVAQVGDVWACGRHTVVCGDATDTESYPDERFALCLTDPPYGVGWQYASHDDTTDNLDALIAGFLPIVRERCQVVALTPGNSNQHRYPVPDWTLCWFCAAGVGCGPWGFICWHPVQVWGTCPYLASGQGSRPDGVAMMASDDVDHPCPKPLKVWAWFMERCSLDGTSVLDPFLGSGTTLMAAEQLGRTCYGIEIEPRYIDVILQRYMNFTNVSPRRERDGALFSELVKGESVNA